MKKYIAKSISLAAIIGTASVMFSSCEDTLDADKYFDDRVTFESVFTDVNQTNQWLSQAYSYLRGHLREVTTKEHSGQGFHVFADDIFWGDRDNAYDANYSLKDAYYSFKQGDYDENYGDAYWSQAYNGIYQASVFIHNIYRQDKMDEETKTDMKGQARFVRAYYYWLLLRKYGPVPIMPDEGADYTLSYEALSYPRASYEEVAEYISSEMIQAAKELSSWSRVSGNTSTENIARPTKGAALATRALAYIFAASPLANGQHANGGDNHISSLATTNFVKQLVNKDGKQLLSSTYDEAKWARAAAACLDVINSPANYELYHATKNETDSKATGYPVTITPYQDGDFSEKAWPDGYADIDPFISYRDLFNGVVGLDNSEVIFGRGYSAYLDGDHSSLSAMASHAMPSSLNGWNCHGMTQKMVDAYYMNDGTDCPGRNSEWNGEDADPRPRTTGYSASRGDNVTTFVVESEYKSIIGNGVSMQYVYREPRFYACVGFNGAYWYDQNPNSSTKRPQIWYWRDGVDGVSNTSGYWQRSGVAFAKYLSPTDWRERKDAGDYSHIVQKWEPAIRYADILLLYAEALNELTSTYTVPSWDGSENYTINRNITEMKRGVRPVRIRAGVPDFPADVYADQGAFRKKIKRERMIEFVGEGKRYYDLRRWMDAAVEESTPIYGCNVNMPQARKDDFHKIVPIYSLPTIFNEKMYFWPISTTELKRNKNLIQNPGWKYYD
ncbi:MAG: RagB/SusD family nutrient uptake outer membrane protein [Bacteroidales bacterium]|nr:RagB/SusD family nutrient uptake outer membrane protein [Bacteroidales bacterium]